MKKTVQTRASFAFCIFAGYFAACSTASAGYLYQNGPVNGNENAFPIDISDAQAVSDSFVLGSTSNVTGFEFIAWLDGLIGGNNDPALSVEWAITTTPFLTDSGSTIASGTSPLSVTSFPSFLNGFGAEVVGESFSIPTLVLSPATTYWIQLSNAAVFDDGQLYWDENDGPSSAYQATIDTELSSGFDPPGSVGSESFRVEGTTPEPGTAYLLLGGFLLLAIAGRGLSARRSAQPDRP